MRVLARAILLTALVGLAGCGEPPSKEMNQAQGAIDAARAAGAEQYAADEFTAAVTALQQSHEAADARDYRQALSHALDSREHAQNAAREASTARAQARGQAERLLAQVTAAVSNASARLDAARAAKVPAKALAAPEQTIAGVQHALQEAGTALGREDYREAQRVLTGKADQAAAAARQIAEIHAAAPARPARRRR